MANTYILFSIGISALPDLIDDLPASLQLLFIPTADLERVESPREHLAEMGFQIDDLELATASRERVAQAVAAADVIFVDGGNTYYLLDQMNRSGFREALAQRDDVIYAGGSAGAVVVCPDIAFIGDLDDPSAAPELESTKGLGLVDFTFMPHTNYPKFEKQIAEILASLPSDEPVVAIRDDQAVVVRDGKYEIVDSPQ